MFNRIAHSGIASVDAVPVVNLLAAGVFIRLVLDCSSKSHAAFIESGRVGGKNLKAGTRLPCRTGCTVQGEAGCLLAASAHDGFHLPGVLVHNNNRCLGLKRDVEVLVNVVPCVCVDAECSFVLIHSSLCVFL